MCGGATLAMTSFCLKLETKPGESENFSISIQACSHSELRTPGLPLRDVMLFWKFVCACAVQSLNSTRI